MPLIDAYIKCDNIAGSYKTRGARGETARLEFMHDGWSEIYSFEYSLDSDEHPELAIKKPVDGASNDLYLRYLRNRSRENQKGKAATTPLITELKINLCRWVDTNNDGIVDESQIFLEYSFKNCRVLEYETEIDCEADDLPEESITFGFREMAMHYYYQTGDRISDGSNLTDQETKFSWNFATLQPSQ